MDLQSDLGALMRSAPQYYQPDMTIDIKDIQIANKINSLLSQIIWAIDLRWG